MSQNSNVKRHKKEKEKSVRRFWCDFGEILVESLLSKQDVRSFESILYCLRRYTIDETVYSSCALVRFTQIND